MLDFITPPEFTNYNNFVQNSSPTNEDLQGTNGNLSRGFGYDHPPHFPTVPAVPSNADGVYGTLGLPPTHTPVPLIENNISKPAQLPANSTPQMAGDVQFHVKTRTVFICAYQGCNKEFGRKPELYRHHRSIHRPERPYTCLDNGCSRSIRGFPRTDKRDDHERKVHKIHRSRRSEANAM